MLSETAHIWKKINNFTFNDLELSTNQVAISINSFGLPVSVKHSTLGTVIYVLERIY